VELVPGGIDHPQAITRIPSEEEPIKVMSHNGSRLLSGPHSRRPLTDSHALEPRQYTEGEEDLIYYGVNRGIGARCITYNALRSRCSALLDNQRIVTCKAYLPSYACGRRPYRHKLRVPEESLPSWEINIVIL
jgi:hypothetical protein